MTKLPFTPRLKKIISLTNERSETFGRLNNVVDLLRILIEHDEGTTHLFQKFSVKIELLIASIDDKLEGVLPQIFEEPKASTEFNDVIQEAKQSAEELEHGFVDTEHVLHSILNNSTTIRSLAGIWEIPIDEMADMAGEMTAFDRSNQNTPSPIFEGNFDPSESFPNLFRYCKNLNSEIYETGLKIIGREKEINHCFDIISRKQKNNVLLLGEPGVGRKSIVRGMAEKIISGTSSTYFDDYTVFEFDLGGITAGASMVGSLEARFKNLYEEIKRFEKVILLINNVQSTFGTGGKEGALDAANLLKQIISDENISTIATATQADFKKYIERDVSFCNLFETYSIEEPKKEEIQKIVQSTAEALEEFHKVKFTPQALDTVINLCERFLPYKKFPEKAIDFLDFVGAQSSNQRFKIPTRTQNSIGRLEEAAFSLIGKYKDEEEVPPEVEKRVQSYLDKIAKKYDSIGKKFSKVKVISENDIISPFGEKYRISENQLRQAKSSSLDEIAESLKSNIFGQNEAIDKVIDVLRCSKVGLRDSSKPLGKFIFVGETSVGKSYLAKSLAEHYFGDRKACLKLDMSEFHEKYSITSLIGSTAGYIGYENGGRLTEFVKTRPNCVVLLDEIEKAHPDICHLLLQIMEDGHITDGQNYTVDFTNTIIILTSNLGSGKQRPSVGFHNTKEENEHFLGEIKGFFKPEFLARLDDVIPFKSISDEDLTRIIEKELSICRQKLIDSGGISLNVDESLKQEILRKAKKDKTHARKIQALIRQDLEIPLSKFIIQKSPKKVVAKFNEKLELY